MSGDVKSRKGRLGKTAEPQGDAGGSVALTQSPARARTRGEDRLEVDAQVRAILEHMTRGEFVLDRDGPAYAEEWGVSLATVGRRSADAARHLRLLSDPEQRESLRARWLLRLDDVVMRGEDRYVAGAAKVAGEFAGMIVHKHEVSPGDGPAPKGTPEEHAALYESAARALRSGR